MTPEQIAHIMALVEQYADARVKWRREAVEASLSAPQQAEEILQSLGWTCIGGVWTEDRAATATLATPSAPQQAEGWVSLDRKLVEQAVEVLMEMGLEDTGLGLHSAMLAVRPSAPTHYEEQPDGTMLPDGTEPDERAEFEAWIPNLDAIPDLERDEDGYYQSWDMQRAWAGWQARASKGKP